MAPPAKPGDSQLVATAKTAGGAALPGEAMVNEAAASAGAGLSHNNRRIPASYRKAGPATPGQELPPPASLKSLRPRLTAPWESLERIVVHVYEVLDGCLHALALVGVVVCRQRHWHSLAQCKGEAAVKLLSTCLLTCRQWAMHTQGGRVNTPLAFSEPQTSASRTVHKLLIRKREGVCVCCVDSGSR